MTTTSRLNRKVQLAFGSAIVTLLVVGAISYRGMAVSSESDRWVRHTHEVLENLQDLSSTMESIESSSRGFILTGKEPSLESYRASILSAEQDEATVRSLTADNPVQRRQLPALEALVAQKIQFAEMVMNLRRAKGLEAAADAIRSGADQRIMDEFQGVVRKMRDEELRLLVLRDADAKRRLGQTKTVLILGTILGLFISAAAGWSVQRHNSGRGLAEESLRGSEEKYRMLVDGVQDYAIFMLDPRGQIISWNAGAERIKGYTAEQIIGHNCSCFFTPDDIKRGRPEEILRMTAASGRHEEQSVRVRKDGSRFLANVTFTALRDAAGSLRGFSEISHDLSEIKESEAKYRGLLEAAPDAIVVVKQGGEIVLLNVQAEKQFGYRRDELVGQKVKSIIPEGFAERLIADALRSAEDALAQQIGTGIELSGRRKDGSEFPIEIMLSPLESAEGILVTAAIRDITTRKESEANLRRALEAAEAASQAKTLFLTTMSHELRTPLNGVLGMTEMVLDSDLTVEQRENLGIVRQSGESLLLVINDVLDFSRIEAGKLELESIPFDLRESLGEALKALAFQAHQKGLELIYEVQPDVSEALFGDPARIRQILVNLIGNAIKFTGKGEIFVTVEEQSQGPQTTCLRFAVKDTGVGIPLEKQGLIFEAFSQADGSMTRKYGGAGLGLAICVRLVEMMRGRIWVESQPGEGSTFFFTVQLGVQNPAAARPALLRPEQLRDLHTLIVDHNFTSRQLLYGMLSRWGMRPIAVEGGRAALQALETARSIGHPFPLVLLNAQMPEMDGFTLAEHIRKNPDLVSATIMMLTSAGHLGDAARCRELGIAAYLVKPVHQRDLFDAICKVLDESSQKQSFPLVTRHMLRETRHRSRVLLAEDNAVNRTLAVRLLEKRGYTVSVVADGRAALAALEKEHFDVVLMDVQMPEMDGFEATASIRAKEKSTGGHIPIIALTAHSLKADQERCLAAGMDGYISKPIRTNELFATIEKVLAEVSASDVVEQHEEHVRPGQ